MYCLVCEGCEFCVDFDLIKFIMLLSVLWGYED